MTTWDHYLDETPYTWADYQTFRAWYAGDPRRTDTLDAHRARRLCLMVDAQADRIASLEAALRDLLIGAEQQSQSHVDVAAKVRAALGETVAGEPEPVGPLVTDPDRSPQNREAGGW